MIKRENFKRFLCVAFWLFMIVFAFGRMGHAGTAYYVDPTAPAGGNGSYESPWNSIAQVNAKVFNSGDDVYFKAGTTLTMTAHLLIDWHGTEADPVVIGAYYGDGLFGLNGGARPILLGSHTTPVPSSEYVGLINYVGTGYITVQDVHVEKSYGIGIQLMQNYYADGRRSIGNIISNCVAEDNGRQGVVLARTSYSVVEDCLIDGSSQIPTVTANGVRYAGAGIEVTGMNRETSVYNVIRGNTVRRAGESIGNYLGARYTTIEDNIVYDIARAGIYAANSRDGIIRNNIVYMSDGVSTPNPLPDWGRRPLIWVDCEGHIDSMIMVNGGWQIYGNYVAGGSHGIWLQSNGDEYGVYQVNTKVYDNRIVDCDANIYVNTDVTGWTGNEIHDNYSFIFTSGLQHVYGESPVGVTWTGNHYNTVIDGVSGNAATAAVYDDPDLTKTTGWRALPVDGSVDSTWWDFYQEIPPYNQAPVISSVTPGTVTLYADTTTAVTLGSTITDPDGDDIQNISWKANGTEIGTTASPGAYTFPTTPGTYTVTIDAEDEHGLAATQFSFVVTVVAATPSLGRIQAEDYDTGGQNVGYYDTTADNQGGAYRPSDYVDIWAGYGGYYVGANAATEWRNYTVNVPTTGNYTFKVRYSTASTGKYITFKQDGTDICGNVSLPSTGSLSTWAEVTDTGDLTAGERVIRQYMDTNLINIDWFEIYPTEGGTPLEITIDSFQAVTVGTFKEGDTVIFLANLSSPGTITDDDADTTKDFYALVETGDTDAQAKFTDPAFGSSSQQIYFSFTVAAGMTTGGAGLVIKSLNLDGDGSTIDLTLPADVTLEDIDIDTSTPTISAFYYCTSDGTQVTADTDITAAGQYYVCLESDGDSFFFADGPLGNLSIPLVTVPAVTAYYYSGIGTSKLIFYFLATPGVRGTDIGVNSVNDLAHGATKLTDQGGNEITYTLPNTWLINANALDFAIPKTVATGTAWWVPTNMATDAPATIVNGDHFILTAASDTFTTTNDNLFFDLPNQAGTYAITFNGDNCTVMGRYGQTITVDGTGTGNKVVYIAPWR